MKNDINNTARTDFAKPILEPVKYERGVPLFDPRAVLTIVANDIAASDSQHVTRRMKHMSQDMINASKVINDAETILDNSLTKYEETAKALATTAKRTSGDVRKAADDLASGLAKVEKTANFANLEKYVQLLERAATAMQQLAELEKLGKLDKIANALK